MCQARHWIARGTAWVVVAEKPAQVLGEAVAVVPGAVYLLGLG
jgi:hypothetical protein